MNILDIFTQGTPLAEGSSIDTTMITDDVPSLFEDILNDLNQEG